MLRCACLRVFALGKEEVLNDGGSRGYNPSTLNAREPKALGAVQVLVCGGATVGAVTGMHANAAHLAAANGHLDVVLALLEPVGYDAAPTGGGGGGSKGDGCDRGRFLSRQACDMVCPLTLLRLQGLGFSSALSPYSALVSRASGLPFQACRRVTCVCVGLRVRAHASRSLSGVALEVARLEDARPSLLPLDMHALRSSGLWLRVSGLP